MRRSILGVLLALSLLAAPRAAQAVEPSLQVDLGGGVALEAVLVPAGTFLQGSPHDEKGREDGETQREVRLTHPYYLGRYPVTVGQFARFASVTGYRTEAEKGASGGFGWDGKALVQRKDFTWKTPGFPQTDDRPVTLVTYDDALAFAEWLSRIGGRAFSLPTEAQWEHAYRAGARGPYYEGANEKDALALGWFKENAGGGTHPVGQKKANAFGLHDMAGNVFQWCLDWYAPYPPGAVVDPVTSQPDASDKARRVLRGGSWLKDARHGRAAARSRSTPGSRNADNGFRVVAGAALAPPAPAAPPVPPSPPPSPAPAPARASSGCSDMAIGLGCFGTIALAIVMLVVALVRRGGRPGLSAGPPIRFQVGADGFRVLAPRTHAGWALHYRYRGPAGAQEGQVFLEPSDAGQFVYTGSPPSAVQVVRLIAPAGMARAQVVSVARVVSTPVVHHHHHDDFRGFPPAY